MSQSKPPSPSIRVEANRVKFESSEGKLISLPAAYGMFHDPSGRDLPKCTLFFGPWKKTNRPVDASLSHRRYLGSKGPLKLAIIPEIPRDGWEQVAKVVKIFYKRRGTRAPYGFYHPFKGKPLSLSRSGRFYRLSLGGGCMVDDRGISFPVVFLLLRFLLSTTHPGSDHLEFGSGSVTFDLVSSFGDDLNVASNVTERRVEAIDRDHSVQIRLHSVSRAENEQLDT
jgi:hypothetical protein